jgi:hypothetical protein
MRGGIPSGVKKNFPLTQSVGDTAKNTCAKSRNVFTVATFLKVSICQRFSFAGWKYNIHPPEGRGASS